MAAGYRAERISGSQYRQPERQRYAQQTNPHFRKLGGKHRTAAPAQDEPECADEFGQQFHEHIGIPLNERMDAPRKDAVAENIRILSISVGVANWT